MRRVVLIEPARSYRTSDFMAGAASLGLEVLVVSDEASPLGEGLARFVDVDFKDIENSVEKVAPIAYEFRADAIVAIDDKGLALAAAIGEATGISSISVEAARRSMNKAEMRKTLAKSGISQPDFEVVDMANSKELVSQINLLSEAVGGYPLIIKPTGLSGSRGVVKISEASEIPSAVEVVKKAIEMFGQENQAMLVERYIDGAEFAVEGVVSGEVPEILAIFDKPRPLDGPYFEETIYLLPSAAPPGLQSQIEELVTKSVIALGIDVGAFHAEVRVENHKPPDGKADSTSKKVFLIEVAARSIGGKCSKSLRFKNGRTLEEVLLARQLGIDLEGRSKAKQQVSGVLMIPTPKKGVLKSFSGEEEAARLPYVTEVDISTPIGSYLRPVPFSDGYLGFVFAKGPSRNKVLEALNRAESLLRFEIDQQSLADECQ